MKKYKHKYSAWKLLTVAVASLAACIITVVLALELLTVNDRQDEKQFVRFHLTGFEVSQLDDTSFSHLTPPQLADIFGQAKMLESSEDPDKKLMGMICYDKISEWVNQRKTESNLDLDDPTIKYLVKGLESEGYYLGLEPPSKFQKLIHYIRDGNFQHIGNRIAEKLSF